MAAAEEEKDAARRGEAWGAVGDGGLEARVEQAPRAAGDERRERVGVGVLLGGEGVTCERVRVRIPAGEFEIACRRGNLCGR